MTPEQLKASILQLAIQGKLVEQRPEEGTAEDLYQQIQEEKQNLIKEGKLKKEKTLAPIEDDEIPFDIPENWKWVRWGNLSKSIQYGLNEPAKSSGEFKYVRISDIQDGKVNWENTPYCDISSAEAKSYLLKSNDILFARTGGTVGKSFLVENVPCDAVFAGYLIRTQCSDNVCPKYCKLFMESNLYWNQLRGGTVATAQPNCNGTTLSKMMIPLPPLAEQKRIVAKVEELLPLVEKYKKAYSELEILNSKFSGDMKKSILQYAIQGKLVEQRPEEGSAEDLYQQIQEEKQNLIKEGKLKKEKTLAPIEDDEIPFDIPENWKWVRWGNLSKSIQYGLNEPAKSSGEFKYVRISDIQDGKVNWENTPYCDISSAEAKSYLLKSNDILFARTGGTVGKSFLVENVPCDAVFAGYLIRTQCSDNVCPKYCKLFMESNLYWNQLRGGTVATAQPNCNGTTLSKMMIPLPPLAEQKRIVAKVEELLALCDKLKLK